MRTGNVVVGLRRCICMCLCIVTATELKAFQFAKAHQNIKIKTFTRLVMSALCWICSV